MSRYVGRVHVHDRIFPTDNNSRCMGRLLTRYFHIPVFLDFPWETIVSLRISILRTFVRRFADNNVTRRINSEQFIARVSHKSANEKFRNSSLSPCPVIPRISRWDTVRVNFTRLSGIYSATSRNEREQRTYNIYSEREHQIPFNYK